MASETDVRFRSSSGFRWRWRPTNTIDYCHRCRRRTTGWLSRRGWGGPCCTECMSPLAEIIDAKGGATG